MNKKKCRAVTSEEKQCSKNTGRFSKYCWHHQDKVRPVNIISNLAVGIVFCLIGIFVTKYFMQDQLNQEKITLKKELIRLKPSVNIEIREKSNDKIVFEIQSQNTKGAPIENLFLKLHLPGVFKDYTIENKDYVGSCEIHSEWISAVGMPKDITSEKIIFSCQSFMPKGFIRVTINYSPTMPRLISGTENTSYEKNYMPLMDLHDYAPCNYTWFFRGNLKEENIYISLKHLGYIKKDNSNLLKIFRREDFHDSLKQQGKDVENPFIKIYTEAWLTELEESRKDW